MGDDKEFKEFKESENLPEGWKRIKLGEICKIITGKKDVNEGNPEGEYYFFTCSRIPTRSDNYSFDTEALLIAGNGEVGTIHYYNGKFEAYQRTYVLIEFASVNVKYIYYYLSKFLTRHLSIEKIGTTIQYIKFRDLDNFFICLPEKESEQQKIAEILETVDNAIEKTDRIIEKYKRIKQGLMHDLLTKGIDENGNIRSEETHKFKDSPLGRIPEEWEVVRLGEVAFITKLAGFEYTEFFDYSLEGEIILIRALNIKDGKLDLTNIYTMPKKISLKLGRSKLKKGDIVMSYVGTIGECAIIPSNNKFHLAPNVAKISVRSKNVLSEYILYYLLGILGKKEIKIVISSTTQDALSMSNIRTIRLLLPSLPEQQRIAEILSQLDQTIEKEEQYKEKLERIKQGLMEDLLTGKVRVKNIIEED